MMSSEQFVPSGSFPDCETSTGVVDMIGNLEEWVLDDWKGLGGMLEGGAGYTHKVAPIVQDDTQGCLIIPFESYAEDRVCRGEDVAGVEQVTPDLISLDRRDRLQSVQTTDSYDSTNRVNYLTEAGWIVLSIQIERVCYRQPE